MTLFSRDGVPPTRHVPHSLHQDKWSVRGPGHFARIRLAIAPNLQAVHRTLYSGWSVNCSFGKLRRQTTLKFAPLPSFPLPVRFFATRFNGFLTTHVRVAQRAAILLINDSTRKLSALHYLRRLQFQVRERVYSHRSSVNRLSLSRNAGPAWKMLRRCFR